MYTIIQYEVSPASIESIGLHRLDPWLPWCPQQLPSLRWIAGSPQNISAWHLMASMASHVISCHLWRYPGICISRYPHISVHREQYRLAEVSCEVYISPYASIYPMIQGE